MKAGFACLIGRPNVGKSTLLNSILGKKIAITSSKAQTTRNMIQGIYNDEDGQIVFVDTPGIHKPNNRLGEYLNKQAYFTISDVDIVIFLIDASEKLGPGDKFIMEKLKDINKPIILVLNKIDQINKETLYKQILEYKDLINFSDIVPVSAYKKDNINTLIKVIKTYLPDNYKYYDEDTITNKPTSFLIAEMVREQIFRKTGEEIPHSTTCLVESIRKKKDAYLINVVIIVDRESLKKIIIGKNGQKIKEIGMLARYNIEELLENKVYLELFVKVIKNWRDKEQYLTEFGYKDFE
ncbi:MAG: GTPase Era [Bacilli bacterium]|nr:GTPase Era [Bacilli bacterium]